MPIEYPSFDDFKNIIIGAMRAEVPELDPSIHGSYIRGLMTGMSATATALGLSVRDLQTQFFPQTAQGEFLDLFAEYEGLSRNAPSGAAGGISVPGDVGTQIPIGTIFESASGKQYQTTGLATVQTIGQAIVELTRVGATATARVDGTLRVTTGMTLTIAGATQPEYNGTFTITVIAISQFTFTVSGTPVSPATGTPTYSANFADAAIASLETGVDTNLDSGVQVTLQTSIAGIQGPGYVQFAAVSGGADLETDESLRERILLSRATLEGIFTPDQIKSAALSVPAITRAFVVRPVDGVEAVELTPGASAAPGQVVVYVLQDDAGSITPPQSVLDAVKAGISTQGAQPAHMALKDINVFAPILNATDFTFTALSPDTPTMRIAVQKQLQAFFRDEVQFETDVPALDYQCAIRETVDASTGERLKSFTLSAPAGAITAASGEIATLGNVTFNV